MEPEENAKVTDDTRVEAGSSPAEAVTEPSADAKEEAPQSSGEGAEQDAKTGEDPKSKMMDIVRDVVSKDADKGESEDGSSPAEASETEEAKADADTKLTDDDKDDDGKPLPFHEHPRWQKMKGERDDLRKQVEEFKAPAEQYHQIEQFMNQSGLVADEVAQGFQVMDMIKNNPQAAYEYMVGAVEVLGQMLGKTVSPELQARIDAGEMTEEAARQLAEAQAQSQLHQQSAQAAQQQQQQLAQQQQLQQMTQQIQAGVSAWESEVMKSDPDYSKKSDMVLRVAQGIRADRIAKGMAPRNAQEAVDIVKEAYENVNKTLGVTSARRQPTDKTPTSSASSGQAASPSGPQSLAEAVRMGANMPVGMSRR